MMYQLSNCVFLAPALAVAAAFPGTGPEPTFGVAERDSLSPAPTAAPIVGAIELFRRADEDSICGYVSGQASREPFLATIQRF